MKTLHVPSMCHASTQWRTSWPKLTTLAIPGHHRPTVINRFTTGDQNGKSDAATGMSQRDTAAADTAPDASTSLQAAAQQDGFVWTRNWWPLAPLEILDPERPTAHTILGQDLVAWWSKEDKSWHVFKDMCPHRLSPLSQGRIVDGSLVCSYHGWAFGPTGACKKIPQIEPAEQSKVCSNKRTCATHYPTMEENNCLYVWLDTSEQGLAESRARGVVKHLGSHRWNMLETPIDFRSWMEQAMDPSHANFLHAGEFFAMEDAIPMAASSMPLVHPTQGFKYSHGGYEKKNTGMVATREFIPPSNIIALYREPTGTTTLTLMFVPVKPGVARLFSTFGLLSPSADHTIIRDSKNPQLSSLDAAPIPSQPAPAVDATDKKAAAPFPKQAGFSFDLVAWCVTCILRMALGSKLPHWVATPHTLGDQDCIMMHGQERNLMTRGLSDKDYVMPAVGADVGVAAINRWLRMVKYPASLFGAAPMPPRMTEEQLLDRQSRHTAHCIQCKQGLQLMNKLCWSTAFASVAAAVLAISLGAAALVTQGTLAAAGWPALAMCVASALLGAVAAAMWELREERFVSGVKAWRKMGGLSFAKA